MSNLKFDTGQIAMAKLKTLSFRFLLCEMGILMEPIA